MGRKWNDEEIELLKRNYPYKDCNELVVIFDNKRSKNSIDNKANKMELKKYKQDCEEGFQICKTCKRELPLDFKYFPKLIKENNFRKICRECNPKYKGFLDVGYKLQKYWTKEEEVDFINIYPHHTNEQLRKSFYPELSDKQMTDKAWKLGIQKTVDTYWVGRKQQAPKVSKKLKGRILSEEHRRKISETKKEQFKKGVYISPWVGRVVTKEERLMLSERVKGKWVGINNPRFSNPLFGSDNGRWNGGITAISTALRENIYEWKQDSMKKCSYKCVLTGGKFDNIHHLMPFSNIIKESLNILGLDIKHNLGEYCNKDRELLISKVQELHKKYGLGLCLHKDIHKLFHDKFSYNSFNGEDFQEFVEDYFDGKYDEHLEEKLKSINSHKNSEEAKKLVSFYYAEHK